ncbi:hypothetical protein Aduo_001050 [Ancylostoma duodenale]
MLVVLRFARQVRSLPMHRFSYAVAIEGSLVFNRCAGVVDLYLFACGVSVVIATLAGCACIDRRFLVIRVFFVIAVFLVQF